MGKIVVVGSSNTDMVIRVPSIPKPGETVLGGDFFSAAGGKGANQAVAAARSGGQVTFLACVGEDDLGRRAVEGFLRDGINTDHVKRVKDSPSGVALIFVDHAGENSIAVAPGANDRLDADYVRQLSDVIASADVLLLQLEIPIETVKVAAEIAYNADTRVVLNPAPARPLDESLLRQVSVLTPNETEAELLTGIEISDEQSLFSAATVLREKGVDAVLITLGARGVYVATENDHVLLPAYKVTPIDSTGAGDVFNGALAASLSEGGDLFEAVRFASAAAAISVTRLGAQPSAPKHEEILRFVEERTDSLAVQRTQATP
jgi:ribokinase